MKRTIKLAVTVLAFLLVFGILFSYISNIFRRKAGGASDMIHSFYDLERDSIDVLFLGSSHGYSAIQPNILWKEQGIASYVMCSQRQTMASSYYLLKEALQYQKPTIVMLETYYLFYDKKYVTEASDVQLREAADGMRLGRVKAEMIEDLLEDRTWKEKMAFYFPLLQYHSRWMELTNNDFVSKNFLKGGIFDSTIEEQKDLGIPEEYSEIPEVTLEYLNKMIELCEENGIQLIGYEAPYSGENLKSYNRIHRNTNSIEAYLQERGIPFLYYHKIKEVKFDFAHDFRDWAHLNFFGSEKLTNHLAGYLTEHYSLTDHREDSEYQSWWNDYEECQKMYQEKLGE